MRDLGRSRAVLWLLLTALTSLVFGCSNGATNTDAAIDGSMTDDAANDVGDGARDASPSEDATDDLVDADVVAKDAAGDVANPDVPTAGCVIGMSIACACVDGRTGAQTCLSDHTYGRCECASTDGGPPPDAVDASVGALGPRLIAPQSVSRVTSQRPTLRWVLPTDAARARVEICGDRACARTIVQQEVIGTSWRPLTGLAPGVVWWRVRGLDVRGAVVWSSATWEFVVGQRDAPVDTSFGTVKDFNGDGFDDVAAGSNRDSLGDFIEIFLGRAGVGSLSPSQGIPSPQHVFGLAAGDFNGDGLADLASTNVGSGSAQVRYGSRVGLPQEPSLMLRQSGGSNGFALGLTAADVNGDGFSDLITLSRTGDTFERWANRLEIFLGSERGLTAVPSTTATPPSNFVPPGNEVQAKMSAAGDVNADGFADVLVSWDQAPDAVSRPLGRSWVVAGHPSNSLSDWTALDPPTTVGSFGRSLAGVGDLDGDGIADFAIASSEEVAFYLGIAGRFATRPVRTIQNPEAHCSGGTYGFGAALGRAGDFNGDGRADLAVGARCLPDTGFAEIDGPGSVFLYQGQTGGISTTPIVFRGLDDNAGFGGALAGIGDFNGDGFDDLAVQQVEPSARREAIQFVLPGSMAGPSLTMAWVFEGHSTTFYLLLSVVA